MNENGQRPPRVMSLSQIVCEKYLFRERGLSQSILKISTLKSLAPTEPSHDQTRLPKQCLQHQRLLQRQLQPEEFHDPLEGKAKS